MHPQALVSCINEINNGWPHQVHGNATEAARGACSSDYLDDVIDSGDDQWYNRWEMPQSQQVEEHRSDDEIIHQDSGDDTVVPYDAFNGYINVLRDHATSACALKDGIDETIDDGTDGFTQQQWQAGTFEAPRCCPERDRQSEQAWEHPRRRQMGARSSPRHQASAS
eukprot:TRINITY_DN66757_c0_g4_i2.p1 TRINITY_DN66757_c0_g4~~TRINITY_DN66757_c0_g4_i2.p1  ORF type:complete len:167 (+),score=31.00 TRINITY_DN66757_c0_g4_i2:379-879(+)